MNTSKFWDKMAGSYDESTEKRFASATQKTIDVSKKYCADNMKILDVGCGTGIFTIELAKLVQSVDAIDCSEEMIKNAKDKADSQNISNINWQCSDVINVLKGNKKYNMVTAFNILLYLPDLKEAVSNIYDLLDDDGYFLSVTDCMGDSNVLFKGAASLLSKAGIIPKMNYLKISELENLLKDAGFKILFGENFHEGQPNYYIAAKKEKKNN